MPHAIAAQLLVLKSLSAGASERTRRNRLSVIWRWKASIAKIPCPNEINALIRLVVAIGEMEPGERCWTQAETKGLEAAACTQLK